MRGMRGTVRLRSFATVSASIALAILAMPAVSARQAAEPRPGMKKSVEAADTSRRQPFSVVLLLGDMQGGESLEGVPAAARKALLGVAGQTGNIHLAVHEGGDEGGTDAKAEGQGSLR